MSGTGTGTPITGEHLVDLADAIEWVSGVVTSPDSDNVETMLLQAERAVRDYTKREWTMPAVTETRTCYLMGGSTIFIDECNSVSAVTDADGNALDYTVIPGLGDHIRWVELASMTHGLVNITGSFGWYEIPESVKRAILVTVRTWYQGQFATLAAGYDAGDSYPRILSIPRDLLPLLDSYSLSRY